MVSAVTKIIMWIISAHSRCSLSAVLVEEEGKEAVLLLGVLLYSYKLVTA